MPEKLRKSCEEASRQVDNWPSWKKELSGVPLKDGEPCSHPGCVNHLTHPCEQCGRVGAVRLNA